MKKRIPFVVSLLALSIIGNAYADLDITNQSDGNGEVIFDKSSTQNNTSSGSRFLNSPPTSNNTIIFEDNGNEDMTPSEINAIKAQGGSVSDAGADAESDVNTTVVAKTNVGGDGYAQRSVRNIPVMQTYGSFVAGLDNNINVLKSLPIVQTEIKEIKLPVLKIGASGKNVEILSQSLVDHGFLDLAGLPLATVYDEDIQSAVSLAQKTYGLKEDGIAGPQLYSNLSMNNGQKLKDLIVWRDQVVSFINTAKEEGSKYVIVVNIPSYTLHAINVETGEEVVQSKVIVGKPIHQTPVYRINLVALKYNPTWTPPMSVIKRSVLPNVNSRYVTSHGLRAVDGRGNAYNLNSVSPSDILRGRYTVQQPPGTSNSLGILKFETDSPDDIYLHDTNERSLFNKASRSFSLGCVRVQQWPELAAMLLDLQKEDVFKNINKGKTYIQKVNKTPIFITYSLVDSVDGKIGHYADIYNKIK